MADERAPEPKTPDDSPKVHGHPAVVFGLIIGLESFIETVSENSDPPLTPAEKAQALAATLWRLIARGTRVEGELWKVSVKEGGRKLEPSIYRPEPPRLKCDECQKPINPVFGGHAPTCSIWLGRNKR